MLSAEAQQVLCGIEGVRRGLVRRIASALRAPLGVYDEAAAHRVVDALRQLAARGIERGEAHGVGVQRQPLAAVKHDGRSRPEVDLPLA